MELKKVLRERRSVRRFKRAPVPKDDIRKILEAGTWAPSASNRQHWEFIVIDDRDIAGKLVKRAGAQDIIENSPALIAVLYDKQYNKLHNANIQSVAAAVQNMLLFSHELGYGTCWICGFGDENEAKSILNVPEHLGILCLIMIGEPDEKPFEPARRDLDGKLSFNRYSGGTSPMKRTIRSSKWSLEDIKRNQEMTSRSSYLGRDYEFYSDDDLENIESVLGSELPPKGARILNLLGYDGTVLRKLEKILSRHDVTDYELTEEGEKFVKYKAGYPRFIRKLDRDKPGSYDFITVFFGLEKIPNRESLLKEALRLLRPGGKLIVFLKNSRSVYGIMYNSMERFMSIDGVEKFYMNSGPFEPISFPKIKESLSAMGLSVSKRGFGFFPSEIRLFRGGIDSYSKKHQISSGKKMLAKTGFYVLSFFQGILGRRGFSSFSSTIAIVAGK